METLADLFATFAPRGERTALVYRTGVRRLVYSYAWLGDVGLRTAAWLGTQGVGAGDRVVLWGPNSPWWGAAFWGCVARGAVVVPVDFMSGRDRAQTITRLTGARLVLQSRLKPERFPDGEAVYLEDLEYLLPAVAPQGSPHRPVAADIAELIYTSGTTGDPKGVILTHANLVANLAQVNTHIPVVVPEFTFLSLLPLSHMFEQMGGFLTPLAKGCSIVYPRTLKPSAIMESLAEEDVAVVIAVPRLLQLLRGAIERELEAKGLAGVFRRLRDVARSLTPERRRLLFLPVRRRFGRNFRLFVSGGAPLDPELFRFWSLLGFTVVEGYGLSECAPVLTANTMERQVPGAVGRPLPGVEVRLEGGEVLVRGPNVFPGYYGNEAATRQAFTSGGWFRTGDLGELDSDGWLRIKGRAKELIVTGAGINVFPDEIEALFTGMAGVREACVIGLDRGAGEEVHAVLIPDGSGRVAESIIREVNDRLDPLHQITGWSLWPEAEFPKTTTMKIRKFVVQERLKGERREGEWHAADRLTSLIARVTGAAPAEIDEHSLLVADLGLTSIGRLELVNMLEQEFRLDLDDAVIGPGTRVEDLRRVIERREKVTGARHYRFWTNSPPVRGIRRLCDLLVNFPLLGLVATVEARGREHLAGLDGPVLFVANHTSYLDQPAIMRALPAKRRYWTATAAWAEFFFVNFKNPLQHLWKRFTYEYCTFAINVFPLPQSSGFRASLHFMGRLADSGVSILVFPEGERTRDGRLLPFRLGLGIMARELRLPLVPVRLDGLEYVLPRDARWPRRGAVTVTFGAPLTFTTESDEEIVSRARQAIESLCGEPPSAYDRSSIAKSSA
jgi:long-chain acyl-CoA synthetase